MKAYVGIIFSLFWSIFGYAQENTIQIEFKNLEEGTVYISEVGESTTPQVIGEATFTDGQATIELPKVEFQTLNILWIKDKPGQFFFISENQPLTAVIYTADYVGITTDSKADGGPGNEQFQNYMADKKQRDKEIANLSKGYDKDQLTHQHIQDNILAQQAGIDRAYTSHAVEVIKEHPDMLASLFLLSDFIKSKSLSLEELTGLFDSLNEEVKNTHLGQQLAPYLTPLQELSIGDKAPNFSAPTPQGKEVNLNNVLAEEGSYTLLMFWASWCPYCQEELPELVDIYAEYHSKGLKIVGISLDKYKSDWQKAITDYGLNWTQVSHLKRWEEPIVKEYQVNAIPMTYLLNQQGEIIEKGLTMEELKEKLPSLFP